MELWAIVVSAVLGLTAGQIGAWLQGRRDVAAELGRQQAETERLREQLRDSREQRDRDRVQADTLEWRERRLATYAVASAATDFLIDQARQVTVSRSRHDISVATDACRTAGNDLKIFLSRCSIIGTRAIRETSHSLTGAAAMLYVRASFFYWQSVMLDADDSELYGLMEQSQASHSTAQLPLSDDMAGGKIDRAASDLRAAIETMEARAVAWREAVRAELGVPD